MGYISMSVVAFLVLFASPVVLATDTDPIPEVRAQIPQWFKTNVKPYSQRRGTLDPALNAAEASRLVITVSKLNYIFQNLVLLGSLRYKKLH